MKPRFITMFALLALVHAVNALAGDSDTRIQISDTGVATSGKPVAVSVKISDPDGVDTVRLYFKFPLVETFAFIPLKAEGNEYRGVLPAPAEGTHRIDQLVLVKDGAGYLSQSRFFRTRVKTPDSVAENTPEPLLTVYSELSPAPDSLEGFAGNIVVKPVPPNRKYGVVAGLIDAAAAGVENTGDGMSRKVSGSSRAIQYDPVVLGIAATAVAVALLLADSSSGDDSGGSAGGSSTGGSGSLREALDTAITDEYKARDTYRAVISRFGNIIPFRGIVNAEQQHIDSLKALYSKYRYPVPSDPWGSSLGSPPTVLKACQAGVDAEIVNANMYDALLAATREYDDVQAVFSQLQAASRNNHLPAFQRCVDRERG